MAYYKEYWPEGRVEQFCPVFQQKETSAKHVVCFKDWCL